MSGTDLRQRLAAILAADVEGYSRLMAADERSTVTALDAARGIFRAQIESHQGRIIDMAGDSVLAVFETATGAVEAAIAIQDQLRASADTVPETRRMRFRIGLHLGDVMEKPDGSVYGDGVNIAARLEGLAEPGGITISDAVKGAVRTTLAATFEDQGEQEVKNIPHPVRAFRVAIGTKVRIKEAASPTARLTLPDKPSIAVLPFENMSGDPEQGFFADGMSEDIITLLSSVPNLFVIARNSTFAYKGRSYDVRDVAQELGVRYVLEGSVRKAGNRIRVTAQFIDAETGNHVWANRYDRDLEDIFAVQDEVAQGIVGTLQSRLLVAEASLASRKLPEALDAWGNVVQAKVKLFAYRRHDIDQAEPFARRAVEIEPDYGEAQAVLGHILAWRSYHGWTDDWLKAARDSVSHCERALALAPNDSVVLTHIGFAYWWIGRFAKGLPILERANSLNPNDVLTCSLLGMALSTFGRVDEGIEYARRAFRLSPKDPLEYLFHTFLAGAQFFAGRYDDAKETAGRALQSNPDLIIAMLVRAASCVRLNQHDEARVLLARVERLGSSWAVDSMFRLRTEGTLWAQYTGAIREVMDREPRR